MCKIVLFTIHNLVNKSLHQIKVKQIPIKIRLKERFSVTKNLQQAFT